MLLHPGETVVVAIRAVFDRFAEMGSAGRVWPWFCSQGLRFPLHSNVLLKCATARAIVNGRGEYCVNVGGVQIDAAVAAAFLAALTPAAFDASFDAVHASTVAQFASPSRSDLPDLPDAPLAHAFAPQLHHRSAHLKLLRNRHVAPTGQGS